MTGTIITATWRPIAVAGCRQPGGSDQRQGLRDMAGVGAMSFDVARTEKPFYANRNRLGGRLRAPV